MKRILSILKSVFNIKVWGYGLFWSWNLIFLSFMLLGFSPNVLPQMIESIQNGLIPILYLVRGALLTLIPVAAVILGVTRLRNEPGKLLALGYGIEGPLMLLLLVRIFLLRETTPAVFMLYTVAVLSVLTLLWQLLDRRIDERGKILGMVRLSGLTLLFLIGVYAAILVAFYAIPLTSQLPEFISDLARGFWDQLIHLEWKTLVLLPMTFFGFLLLGYTATLVLAAPIAVPVQYIYNWWIGVKSVSDRAGRLLASVLVVLVSLAAASIFILANQQPQHQAYALLKTPPGSLEEALRLRAKQEIIRSGLLNAYLAPVRYISAVGEVGHIQDLYQWSFDISAEDALQVEKLYELAARPMLYEPMAPVEIDRSKTEWWNQLALRTEPQIAAELYENYFDQSIFEGERETIVRAVKDTWSGEQALAAWQGVDDREILLLEQEVSVVEHGDWAEVELFEAYQNQTSIRQEVVYYFSLPETASVTGLWLGNSPNREARYSYLVAPRGAAQQVYREQVRINVDPALLEQIGPRQYRLRIFPIEPQVWRWDEDSRTSKIIPGQTMYMWMTYTVLADENRWPLPQLAERANVYWNESTKQTINGVLSESEEEQWLPESVDASGEITPTSHQVNFPSGDTVILQPVDTSDQPSLPEDLKIAVVLDRSGSMEKVKDSVTASLEALRTASADIDVYLTASEYRGESASVSKLAALVPDQIIYYGGQNAAELLGQFFALSGGRNYDVLLILTDGSGFRLGGMEVEFPVPASPVWMVHLDGRFPMGYDDASLQAIQASGGGVAGSLEEAILRMAVSLENQRNPQGILRDIVDGYELLTFPAGVTPTLSGNPMIHLQADPFAALATRHLVLSEMQRARGQITELETLDAIHALAKEQGIVTPYSSMIVLVDAAQLRRLENLEGKDNRFEREAEAVGETTPSPFEVTGVPEPHEWLLIFLGAGLLVWMSRQRFLKALPVRVRR